jgi:hypothetical protein
MTDEWLGNPEIITDPKYGISYQRVPTFFRLFLVQGRDNLGQPIAFVVQATGLQHAVNAVVEECQVDEPGKHRHLMQVDLVSEVYQVERDASPDSTSIIADFRAWGLKNVTSLISESEREKKTPPS